MQKLLQEEGQKHVRETLIQLKRVLGVYDLEKGEVWLSFNGGKDATVVLQLVVMALSEMGETERLKGIYLQEENSFEEVEDFIEQTVQRVGMDLIRVEKDYKRMQDLLQKEKVRAVVMGTRRTDPHSSDLHLVSPTDKGYGKFMRILPILDWDYSQVWAFLDQYEVPYCPLYKEGYTYLGNKTNCRRNQYLECDDGKYSHAREALDQQEFASRHLKDGQRERVYCVGIVDIKNNYTHQKAVNAMIKAQQDITIHQIIVLPVADYLPTLQALPKDALISLFIQNTLHIQDIPLSNNIASYKLFI